jgi:hypothetical protein
MTVRTREVVLAEVKARGVQGAAEFLCLPVEAVQQAVDESKGAATDTPSSCSSNGND